MATTVVAGASAAGVFASVPYVGWILAIAAAYVDAAYIAPALAGEGREAAKAPRILDLPVGTNEPGAPRIWAIGARVRVPTHILWQKEKVRETTSGGQKGGTTVQLRRVYIDALIALNDRPTRALKQLRGNGKLLLYKSRNLVDVITDQMRADVSGSAIVLSMLSTQGPTFTDKFEVDDVVHCSQFIHEAGSDDLNVGYWKATAVVDHAPGVPSTMTIVPQSGQSITSSAYNGGNPFSPAKVERVDDAWVEASATTIGGSGAVLAIRLSGDNSMGDVFTAGDKVIIGGVKDSSSGVPMPSSSVWRFTGFTSPSNIFALDSGPPISSTTFVDISATNVLRVDFLIKPQFTAGLFPQTFTPSTHYHPGTETQGEESLLAAAKGTGNIPAYRGIACQGLDQFFATQFGDQLPFALEALLDVDDAMSWADAASQVLQRAGIPVGAIDVSGVSTLPFGGMFLRGAVPTLTAMQPMLVAGQIIGQERDGTICLFHVDNADVIQVENGAFYSDLAARDERDQRSDNKVLVEDDAEEDLPTSIGIRHQDPDNQYADGYQHFGLRNPGGVSHQNEQELDLSNIVLTRKEARNLATTVMRRAWINRRKYRFTLPPAYLDLLENDITTFTTDDGDIVRCRIIQRDVGSDFRVNVTAIAEDVDLEVYGSPVQTGAGQTTPIVITPALLVTIPLDIPAIDDGYIVPPAIWLAVCAYNFGENWAGARVFESINGATYQQVGYIPDQAAIGTFDGDLTAQDPSEEYGTTTVTLRSQTVDVSFIYEGAIPLEAATQAEAEAGKNWVAILSNAGTPDEAVEIAAFTTVTPNGSGNYTLGGWLRGLRGTSSVIRSAGSIVVLLYPPQNNVFRRAFSVLPTTLDYKVVPSGADIDDVDPVPVTPTWRNARPLPVRSIQKIIGASPYNARIKVLANWTRAILPPGTQPPHPIDEPFEAYRLDIYDPTGATLVRSKTITSQLTGSPRLRDRWFDYPASEQTADGYTPSATETFFVDCVQLGQFGESPSILQEL